MLDDQVKKYNAEEQYAIKQAAISRRWLTLQFRALRSQLAAATFPDDQAVREEAEGHRQEFLSLADSYIASEVPKRPLNGIPLLNPETKGLCEDLYRILDRRIPSGHEGADKRLAVLKVARLHANDPVRTHDTSIVDSFNEAIEIRNMRANAARLFTVEDAKGIMDKSGMLLQSFADSVSAPRRNIERGNITPPSHQPGTDDWMSLEDRLKRAQNFALDNQSLGQPHPGNVRLYEKRMYETGYKSSLPSPSPLPRASSPSTAKSISQASDSESASIVPETPKGGSPAPTSKKHYLQDDEVEQGPSKRRQSDRLRERSHRSTYGD
ncbi:hypothetical protein [Rhizobium terrae]|uniref:hypothetical protein n=1 Tax=Rhizobium terrae TaxID=2171756 RepID=UPI000E3C01EA|nr:hypothetical protein [Rhizobium terrae]